MGDILSALCHHPCSPRRLMPKPRRFVCKRIVIIHITTVWKRGGKGDTGFSFCVYVNNSSHQVYAHLSGSVALCHPGGKSEGAFSHGFIDAKRSARSWVRIEAIWAPTPVCRRRLGAAAGSPPGVSFTDSTARKCTWRCRRRLYEKPRRWVEIDDKRDIRVWESMERSRPVPVTYRRRYVAGAACCGHRGRSPAWTAHPTCC